MDREGISIDSTVGGAILVGNGINRLNRGPSWEELLISLADHAELPNDGYELDLEKPFPLLYEELLLRGALPPRELERRFADEVRRFSSELTQHDIHKNIRSSPFRHILTTNYDLALEGPDGSSDLKNSGIVQETKYSVFRRFDVGDKHYWHIHGDVIYDSSIMLGYDHYAGALERIRQYVTSSTNYENYRRRSLISRIGPRFRRIESWVDLFFTADVHIVALALDMSEMHLWWLLTYRERQRQHRKNVRGTIRYYARKVRGLRRNAIEARRLSLLESLGVEVIEVEVGHRDWERFYDLALNRAIERAAA